MRLNILDEHSLSDALEGSDRLKKVKARVLGDPQAAPRRLGFLLVFAFFVLLVYAGQQALQANVDTSGSSVWVVRVVSDVVGTLWFAVFVAAVLYLKWIGRMRTTYARNAAEVTGWLSASVQKLADSVRTTDHTRRIIVTSDHEYDTVREYVDAALADRSHPAEAVDYYGRHRDGEDADDDATVDEAAGEIEDEDIAGELTAAPVDNGQDDTYDDPLGRPIGDLVDEPSRPPEDETDVKDNHALPDDEEPVWDFSETPDTTDAHESPDGHESRERPHDETESVESTQEVIGESQPASRTERLKRGASSWKDDFGLAFAKIGSWTRTAGRVALAKAIDALQVAVRAVAAFVGLVTRLFGLIAGALRRVGVPIPERDRDPYEPDPEVPWRIRVAEELKHTTIDLSAGYRSEDVYWRLLLPAAFVFVSVLLASGLWVNPLVVVVAAGGSLLVGGLVFAWTKRRRSTRIQKHTPTEYDDYWNDVGARVKTVETEDVTAYVGFIAGKSYLSYDRQEFIDEFALRLWQKANGERVAPSILEQYARNAARYAPNLIGHRDNIEVPEIQRRIKQIVEESPNRVIEKAELAFRVIEPDDEAYKFEDSLGHDPRLVAREYRWLVEEAGILEEMSVEMPGASGVGTELTLVYPAEKQRLPDTERLHSQVSDRFYGLQGEPYYKLPKCNAAGRVRGFVPNADALSNIPNASTPSTTPADD